MYLCEDDTAGEEGLVARAALSENVNFKVSYDTGLLAGFFWCVCKYVTVDVGEYYDNLKTDCGKFKRKSSLSQICDSDFLSNLR